jgi:hypothetical protein
MHSEKRKAAPTTKFQGKNTQPTYDINCQGQPTAVAVLMIQRNR